MDTASESTGLLDRTVSHKRSESTWPKTIKKVICVGALLVLLLLLVSTQHSDSSTIVVGIKFLSPPFANNGVKLSPQRHPVIIELCRFYVNNGTSVNAFLEHARALGEFFGARNHSAAVQRSLTRNAATGEWADIVFWTDIREALQAGKDILVYDIAQPFLRCINVSTMKLDHSTIVLDWMPLTKATVVEIAQFPLVSGVTDTGFVEYAMATTSFFEKHSGSAKHRILSHGYENTGTWFDFVYWSSVSKALQAGEDIESVPSARPFLDSIDGQADSFDFAYFDVEFWQDFE